jgi:hypothetical protein
VLRPIISASRIGYKNSERFARTSVTLARTPTFVVHRFYDTIAELRKFGYSGRLISENFYDRDPIGNLNEDPVELMLKDYQVLEGIVW